jgi:aldose 1-epimerase
VSLNGVQALLSSDPNGLPIHGVLPGRLNWQVQAGSGPDRITARLRWKDPELLEVFPFAHEACFEAQAREGELEISVTVRPTGSDQLPVSFGFHPYLRLPGTPRQRNRVKLSAFRRLVLDERSIPTGERVPLDRRSFRLGDRSLDDGLDGLALPSEFAVSAGGVTITMTFEYGFSFAQVYAPPDSGFICFEPMTAATNALRSGDGLLVLEPGEEHRSAFSIRIARRGA